MIESKTAELWKEQAVPESAEWVGEVVNPRSKEFQGNMYANLPIETAPGYLQPGWRTRNKGPQDANTSGFRATGHRILLIPEPVEKTTESGIILAAKTVRAEEQIAVICTVLEIGPDAWTDKSTDYCDVGDRVLIGQYVGKFHDSPMDGKTYRFVSDLDIISPLPKQGEKK